MVAVMNEYEIERGKPMPSKNHATIQMTLGAALFNRYRNQYSILSELSLELPGQPATTPDICVYPRLSVNWTHDESKMTTPPLLAIEILSPTQGMQDIMDKFESYFQGGVKSCWLVQPFLETVTVFSPDMKRRVFAGGDVIDAATGISVSIDDIFAV